MSLAIIVILALLSTLRVTALRDGYADDNCWLLLIRETDGLQGFLDKSFGLMHREGPGTIFYLLLSNFEQPWFPWLWHGLNLLTEIGSPVLLYLVVRRYLHHEVLAVLSAVMLIALHGDHTLGYVSGINYRLGLLFSLLSFYWMGTRYWLALGCAVIAMWGCTETALALEPVRMLLLSWLGGFPWVPQGKPSSGLVSPKGCDTASHTSTPVSMGIGRRTDGLATPGREITPEGKHKTRRRATPILASIPFLLSALSLIVYRLFIPTEGMWAGTYGPPESFYDVIRLVLLWPYKEAQDIAGAIWISEPWTWLYGFLGGCTAWVLANYLRQLEPSPSSA